MHIITTIVIVTILCAYKTFKMVVTEYIVDGGCAYGDNVSLNNGMIGVPLDKDSNCVPLYDGIMAELDYPLMMFTMGCTLIFGDKDHNSTSQTTYTPVLADGLEKSVEVELDHMASFVGRSIIT